MPFFVCCDDSLKCESVFGVAQIFNLPYRRIAFCGAWANPKRWDESDPLPTSSRRNGRLQVCATMNALRLDSDISSLINTQLQPGGCGPRRQATARAVFPIMSKQLKRFDPVWIIGTQLSTCLAAVGRCCRAAAHFARVFSVNDWPRTQATTSLRSSDAKHGIAAAMPYPR